MFPSSLDNSLGRGNKEEITTWGKPSWNGFGIAFPFTCPANGFIAAQQWASNGNSYVYINSLLVGLLGITNNAAQLAIFIPVKKGDVVTGNGGKIGATFLYDHN